MTQQEILDDQSPEDGQKPQVYIKPDCKSLSGQRPGERQRLRMGRSLGSGRNPIKKLVIGLKRLGG